MIIARNNADVKEYMKIILRGGIENPVLIDRYMEANPRSSRTVPYLSKVSGLPMIDLATRAMLGEKLSQMGYGTGLYRIAAIALANHMVLVTRNSKHFEPIQKVSELQIENWFE